MTKVSLSNEAFAAQIVDAGAYKTYWDKPKIEWPVSEQGRICPAYCNLRSLIGNVTMRRSIEQQLTQNVEKQIDEFGAPDVICGIVSAGVPWAALLSDRLSLPMCYTRPSIKAHGEKTGIEGQLEPGMDAIAIDDVFLTGNTIAKTSLQLAAAGVNIRGTTVLLRLSDEVANIHYPDGSFDSSPVTSLISYEDLIQVSLDRGFMDDDQAKRLTSYYQNPGTQPWE